MGAKNSLIVGFLAITGCASDPPQPVYNQYEIAIQGFDAANARCSTGQPIKSVQELRRNFQCTIEAENIYLRPVNPYPDLLDLKQARRMALVSRIERRQITAEDAAVELARSNSEIMAEFNRRQDSDRSVRAQEAAAIGLLLR